MATESDPILVQRAKVQRLVSFGQRLGSVLYGVAIVVFLVGLLTDFNSTVAAIVTFGVVAGSVVLAPSILGAYMVKAAVRDDLEHGRDIG